MHNNVNWQYFLVLQLLMLQPSVVRQESDPPSLKALISDPYIVIAAGKLLQQLREQKTKLLCLKRCHNIR